MYKQRPKKEFAEAKLRQEINKAVGEHPINSPFYLQILSYIKFFVLATLEIQYIAKLFNLSATIPTYNLPSPLPITDLFPNEEISTSTKPPLQFE